MRSLAELFARLGDQRRSHCRWESGVIQALGITVGASRELIRRLDAFRKKRNMSSYKMGGTISEKEAAEMAAFAADRQEEERWIREKHPELKLSRVSMAGRVGSPTIRRDGLRAQ